MPELPEVETVVQTLRAQILNKSVISTALLYPRVIQTPNLGLDTLVGHTFLSIERKGKFIIFNLDDDLHMVVHLRMEGKMFFLQNLPVLEKAVSYYLTLDEGYLVFSDTRKFGITHIFKGSDFYHEEPLNKVGPDPFDMNEEQLFCLYTGEKGFLKEALLNQSLMSGVGNIYADEILFAAHLSPFMSPGNISKIDAHNLLINARRIMSRSIELGGSTVRSYLSSEGHAGNFQSKLKVYSHENEPCPVCKIRLEKRFLGGRGTTFCRHCQHLGLSIGITGLIGTGKSTLVKAFVDAGFILYDCDAKVAEYYGDPRFIKEAVAAFSPLFDREFSKQIVLECLLKDPSFRSRFESFIYHKINQDILNFLNHHADHNVVVEAPRLFEARLEKYFSYVIAVTADIDTVKARLEKRGTKNIDELITLNKKSMLIRKIAKVDLVVENDGTAEEFKDKASSLVADIKNR